MRFKLLVLSVFGMTLLPVMAAWSQATPAAPVISEISQDRAEVAAANNAGAAAYRAGKFEEAVRFWTPLAQEGIPAAEYNLGVLYEKGQGVPQDLAKAASFYRKAADQGVTTAQLALGRLNAGGRGMPKDYIESYKWLSLAILSTTDSEQRKAVTDLRDMLTKLMSPAQLTEARKLVAMWKPVPPSQYDPETISNNQTSPHVDAGVTRQLVAGIAAYNAGDYKGASTIWTSLANSGDREAQNNLGQLYSQGLGVHRDYTLAAEWFQKAADQGMPEAQRSLGSAYLSGRGVTKDYAMAVYWSRKAADQGFAEAQYQLGDLYKLGDGVTQSYFLPDFAAAVKWYQKAADSGYATAQVELGNLFSIGVGVPKDDVLAYKWYSLAIARSETPEEQKDATKRRDRLARRMTQNQITDAEAQAQAWKPVA